MKLPAIKKLVENFSFGELQKAEEALYEEKPLDITVDGDDEGEQLTHVLAALWILEEMRTKGTDYATALRAYTSKVRSSIN
jgi:hypothetical protein